MTRKHRKAGRNAHDTRAGEEMSPAAAESEARRLGRWLLLKFIGGDKPELDRIQCRWSSESQILYWQQGDPPDKSPMTWTPLPQALALIFLDYLASAEERATGPTFFCDSNSGDLAITLGNAITSKDGRLHELLVERLPRGAPISRVDHVFAGKNIHGKGKGERRIFIQAEQVPPDCIDVYWVWHGKDKITDPALLRELANRIRRSLEIPLEPLRAEGEGAAPAPPPESTRAGSPSPQASPTEAPDSAASLPDFPELDRVKGIIEAAFVQGRSPEEILLLLRSSSVLTTLDRVEAYCRGLSSPRPGHSPTPRAKEPVASTPTTAPESKPATEAFLPPPPPTPLPPPPPTPPSPPSPQPPPSETKPKPELAPTVAGPGNAVTATNPPPSAQDLAHSPPLPRIDPELFEIHNPDALEWEDSMPLLDFGGDESADDLWRLKDACEGVLILGAPGSGKTSASGFAFAAALLSAGFGGLVLTAKPDEARRWQNLCQRFGRAEDCILVQRNGPHRLNAMAYETQRPGERPGLADDLIEFFRVLIAVVSRQGAPHDRDDFWTNATNQLMRELFEAFLLAGEPLHIDSLLRFVAQASKMPEANWRSIPFFGELLQRAGKRIQSDEDQRIYQRVLDYWTSAYPGIAPQTRSGVELGFIAMANALSGRGIHSLISSETTLTPEMILSGKVVILDLSIKECGQGGALIQAAWKFLLQRAIERRADKGRPTARPVFLWEDEGHLFFSQHDIEFQPTARDCRAAHVVISQSLHNFYQLGHNLHAVQGVFATMNTQVFHANGDLETNRWASDKLGTSLQTLVNVTISSQPKRSQEPKHWLLDALRQEERESTSSTAVNQSRDRVFQPERFAQLKKGGDGTCEAVVLWVSHQFKANGNRPFVVKVFEQDNGT